MAQESENTENMNISLGEEDKDKEEIVTVQKKPATMVADSAMDL